MKVLRTVVLFCTGAIALAFFAAPAMSSNSEPGSPGDPLVSRSYVHEVIADLATKTYVDERLASINLDQQITAKLANIPDTDTIRKTVETTVASQVSALTSFQVVELPAGHILIGEGGTEVVLRAGYVTVTLLPEAKGGILNVTTGEDHSADTWVQRNHLLVIPRSDGRGLLAKSDAVLMVKGPYTIIP